MIPLRLHLANFLSYRDCQLDFAGLHTACICGANGAGKSSLLEALTWALWGKSRAISDDDVIRRGATEARVDLTFRCEGQTFRIIRSRVQAKSGTLEFQVGTAEESFRSLTRHTIRATQEGVNEVLKMDYETFINSAYLRQGRADEFTIKRPAERKEVLIEILSLNRYEALSEQSREREKSCAAQAQVLKETLERNRTALEERPSLIERREQTHLALERLRAEALQLDRQLELLRAEERRRVQLAQTIDRLGRQIDGAKSVQGRLAQQWERQSRTVREIEILLEQEIQIAQGCTRHAALMAEEATLVERCNQHQALGARQVELERCRDAERHALVLEHQRHTSRLEHLRTQQDEAKAILQDAPRVAEALGELARARSVLTNFDQRQREAFPKLQEKLDLDGKIHAQQCELAAKAGLYEQQLRKLQQDLTKKSFLDQTLAQVVEKIDLLEKKRVYQQRVLDKGHERRAFKDRLELQQQQIQREKVQIEEKVQLLATTESDCPLCGGALDEAHRQILGEDYRKQLLESDDQLVLLAHQLSTAEHEVRVLRTEYAELARELEQSPSLLTKQAQLRQQLAAIEESSGQIQTLRGEIQNLKQQLDRGDYATEVRRELAGVLQQLQLINYDEKDHAMARSEADRWRWTEVRQAEIDRARKQCAQLDADLPTLAETVSRLAERIAQEQYAQETQAQLKHIQEELTHLDYHTAYHQQVRRQLQESQHWLLRYQEWQKARNRHPEELSTLHALKTELEAGSEALKTLDLQRTECQGELASLVDPGESIGSLDAELARCRTAQESKLSELGAFDERLAQIDALAFQIQEQQQNLERAQHQQRLYRELYQAFGKNGIQALIIENVLPELETETNQLLSRLSDNQLHVQFITQKAAKNARKLIDTLDILINDARGTRPYETYSGGEAYRVNFAIRLALSRLLARRSGAALQTLIIDEGFGTQDQEGRERLVQSINAVADDFACILVITHIQELKDAFQSRIEVEKGHQGSHLSVFV